MPVAINAVRFHVKDRGYRRMGSSCTIGCRWMLAALAVVAAVGAARAAGETAGSASGLPVPRFVSLKSDRVNVRGGPTKDHEVTWVFTRSGLPVEVTAEFENWRRIRDWEGAEGWVYHSLLSGRRTAIVAPKSKAKDDLLTLYEKADKQSAVRARLQSGVLGMVKRCSASWCQITGSGFEGWIEQERLWGVYPNETVE
jgi:SH3-like domain-containing protein